MGVKSRHCCTEVIGGLASSAFAWVAAKRAMHAASAAEDCLRSAAATRCMAEVHMRAATAPLSVIVQVTKRCDFGCVFCSETLQLPDASLGQLETMRDNLAGVHRVFLSGGEPLLRRDLTDIVNMFAGFIIGLPTNATRGVAMAPRLAGKIAFANIGFDGPRATFRRVRGDYDKVMTGVHAFIDAGVPTPGPCTTSPTCSCPWATCWKSRSPRSGGATLAWPDDPYRASQQLYPRPSPMLAAFAVLPLGPCAVTAPAAVAVAYLPLHRTRAITVTEDTLAFGFRAASAADGGCLLRLAGVADLDLMQARRHAHFLVGYALAGDLRAPRSRVRPGSPGTGRGGVWLG